jgi:hypothetical protein
VESNSLILHSEQAATGSYPETHEYTYIPYHNTLILHSEQAAAGSYPETHEYTYIPYHNTLLF